MSAQGSRFLSSSANAKDSDKKLRLSITDIIFLLIVVQNLLPQSMNWQSGVLINDFSRHAFPVSSLGHW